jgi:predicted RNA-binding Zn-ribbon protein involved in translation (DUF1610 family)
VLSRLSCVSDCHSRFDPPIFQLRKMLLAKMKDGPAGHARALALSCGDVDPVLPSRLMSNDHATNFLCPHCHEPMEFMRSIPAGTLLELVVFRSPRCGDVETMEREIRLPPGDS